MLHLLSRGTLPPDDIIADSLLIIGVDLVLKVISSPDKGYGLFFFLRVRWHPQLTVSTYNQDGTRDITNSIAMRVIGIAQDPDTILSEHRDVPVHTRLDGGAVKHFPCTFSMDPSVHSPEIVS